MNEGKKNVEAARQQLRMCSFLREIPATTTIRSMRGGKGMRQWEEVEDVRKIRGVEVYRIRGRHAALDSDPKLHQTALVDPVSVSTRWTRAIVCSIGFGSVSRSK